MLTCLPLLYCWTCSSLDTVCHLWQTFHSVPITTLNVTGDTVMYHHDRRPRQRHQITLAKNETRTETIEGVIIIERVHHLAKGTLEGGTTEGERETGTGIEASATHGPLLVQETITEGLRMGTHGLLKIETVEIKVMTAMGSEKKTIADGSHVPTLLVSQLMKWDAFNLAFSKITTLTVLANDLLDLDLDPGLALATLEQDHQHIKTDALLVHAVVLVLVLAPHTQIAEDMMNTGLRGPFRRPSLPTALPPAVRAHDDSRLVPRQEAHPRRNLNPD
jgi:hypothetical protein